MAKKAAKKTTKKTAKKTTKKTAKKAEPKKKAASKTTKKPAAASKTKKASTSAAKTSRSSNGSPRASAPKPVVKRLTAAQKRDLKDSLLTMREQLANQINSLRDDSLTRNDEVNPAEDGTDAYERQFALNVASSEHDSVVEIDDALRRLDQSQYGKCETCSEQINFERLKALPFVRLCISCQSEEERKHGPYRQASVRRGL